MQNHRPPAMFIADSRGLDFLNSIATPVDKPVEFIGSGEDFLHWLLEADLVPAEVLAALSSRAAPGELDDVAAQARALREWFRGFVDQRLNDIRVGIGWTGQRPFAAADDELLRRIRLKAARQRRVRWCPADHQAIIRDREDSMTNWLWVNFRLSQH